MTDYPLQQLSLTEFRSYERLDFDLAGRSVYLFGPNGAGKTNLLEAVSILNPGKGLRGAAFSELGRGLPDEKTGHPWGVAAVLGSGEDEVRIGTGSSPLNPAARRVHIDGENANANRLLDYLRLIWLTPAQDRIFIESRSERLRFFDRLAYAALPSHAVTVTKYEKALRERMRLLQEHPSDHAWIGLVEANLADAGVLMIEARRAALKALQAEIDSHQGSFPRADLALVGEALERENDTLHNSLLAGFYYARDRDLAAGRSLYGPHRTDFAVTHRDKNRPAAECSTGEQKALLLNIILAQGARLSPAKPILLLDEVAAHLDPLRRHALFDETHALSLQTLFTGTDLGLFDGLKSRALGVRVEAGQFIEFLE